MQFHQTLSASIKAWYLWASDCAANHLVEPGSPKTASALCGIRPTQKYIDPTKPREWFILERTPHNRCCGRCARIAQSREQEN